jgi:hypothetical protein
MLPIEEYRVVDLRVLPRFPAEEGGHTKLYVAVHQSVSSLMTSGRIVFSKGYVLGRRYSCAILGYIWPSWSHVQDTFIKFVLTLQLADVIQQNAFPYRPYS